MKNISLLIFALALFAACKKDNKEMENQPLTAADLVNYYIPLEIGSTQGKFRVIYFDNNGGAISATYDGGGLRRGQAVTVENNIFRFDVNGDGGTIYEFVFAKNNTGQLSLKSYSNKGASDTRIMHAEIFANNSVPGWSGKAFIKKSAPEGWSNYCIFSADKTKATFNNSPTVQPTGNIYAIGNSIGFKDDGIELMGIFVPSWKGNAKNNLLIDLSDTGLYIYGQE